MCRSGTGRHEWRPTGYATNQPPRNNVQPSPRPHPSTRNAADHMCRSGTGRHEWRPHGLRRKTTTAKQRSTTRKRRGATCDARMTDAMPQINRRPARIRRHATRPTTCAVPAPGVINGAPTGDAAKQPRKTTFNRRKRRGATCDARMTDEMPRIGRRKTTNQPTPRPHPPTRNAADHMCRSGTGRHEWRPHGRRHKPAATKQQSTTRKRRGATCDARMTNEMPRIGRRKTTFNRRPARIRRHATRPTTCAVPAPGVINGAPTGYAANRPTKNCKPTATNVGAPLVTPE